MPPGTAAEADGTPRRPLGPRDTPRRAELTAALAVAVLLAHLLLAQLTLVLAAVLYAVGRVGRWRLQWLAVPAGVGLVWMLAVGPSRAAAGLTAGPRRGLAYLGGLGRPPRPLPHPPGAFAGPTRWLPRQLPLPPLPAAAGGGGPGARLWRLGPGGRGCYEPLGGGDPARAAALVMAMLDWSGTGDQQRRSCAAYLTDALAVQAAVPRDLRVPVLDDLVRLLTPAGLRERAALIPAYHPRRDVLADRAAVSAGLRQADPPAVAAPVTQLTRLRSSAL